MENSCKISDFRNQLLWRKAQELAVNLVTMIRALPRDGSTVPISNQLMRSGGSIAANIAEGYGRFSQAAYRNHLSIARGSPAESLSWLNLLVRTGYLKPEVAEPMEQQCIELQKLSGLRMQSLSGGKTYAIGEEGAAYES
jgi:four helix bundle protein